MSKVSTNLTSKIARIEAGSEEYLKLDLRSASEGRESYACDRIGNFPSPRELANLDESFLAKRCGLGYRAGRILKLAQAIVEGRIHLKQLEEVCNEASLTSYDRLAEQLSKIYGFGPFTCANVLVCMGFYHVIPSDSETVRHLKQSRSMRENPLLKQFKWTLKQSTESMHCISSWHTGQNCGTSIVLCAEVWEAKQNV
ncbi:hypothetical protein QYF36_004757 [Acer negundo]|nr:hypothetical protein QYF36_004757 [Acer negundo]